MRLKEKFKQWLDTEPRIQIRDIQLEVIAEDFAIDFAEFQIGLLTKYLDGKWYFDYDAKWLTTKELLEIYKKEKGL